MTFRDMLNEFSYKKSTVFSKDNQYESALKNLYKGVKKIIAVRAENSYLVIDVVLQNNKKETREIELDTETGAEKACRDLKKNLDIINDNF